MGVFSALFEKKDNEKLAEAIREGAFLVDVRTAAEFSMGSAKGAVNIPLDSISGQLEKFRGRKRIVVFCRSGGRSGQAKSLLEKNGFQHVLNGGTWKAVNNMAAR